ncbi:MAG: hypothetical protein ACOC1X_02265 [Promethearchaeota archaeon]
MSSFYKVFFKGNQNLEESELNLTFYKLNFQPKLKIPDRLLIKIKELSKSNNNIIIIENINEVIFTGDSTKAPHFKHHRVLLYKNAENKKEGLLIAKIDKESDFIIGLWPFNKSEKALKERITKRIKFFIDNLNTFKKIALIS